MLILRQPWDSQPPELTGHNAEHPSARGLQALIHIPSRTNVVEGTFPLITGSPDLTVGPGGVAFQRVSTKEWRWPVNTGATSSEFTVLLLASIDQTVDFQLLSVQIGTQFVSSNEWGVYKSGTHLEGDRSGNSYGRFSNGAAQSANPSTIFFSGSGAAYENVLNGNIVVTGTQTVASYSGRQFLYLRGTGAAANKAYAVAYWSRKLSLAEMLAIALAPWQLFEPRRIFVPMSAAGSGFTLALDAGSYTYTGQATGFAVARKLAFDAGSYGYTGQTTGLSYGRKLSLDAGSYSYTGQTTGLAVSRKLPLDAGSYAVTGNDVTLTYDSSTDTYTIALDAGSYTYTGQTTDFKVARKLSFDAGVYSYTGQTTNFAVGRKLSLDAGSYAYTGQATAFVVNRNLALDSGAYTYTGQITGLAYSGSTGFVTIKAGSWLRYRVI